METKYYDFSLDGKIIIRGEGRVDFINGIVSNDVKSLKENKGCYCAFLDKFGKVLSDCVIYKLPDCLLICMNIVGKKNVLPILEDEAALGKSEVEDISMKKGLFSIVGAGKKIGSLFEVEIELESFQNQQISYKGQDLIIARHDRTREEGYDIIFPAAFYGDFKKLLTEDKLSEGTNEEFELLRIQSGKPLFGVDFTSENILPEVTESATSYSKGCFVGQEIVVRVKNLAKGMTAKRLMQFEIDSEDTIDVDSKIMAGDNEAGFITSVAFSTNNKKTVAIGYLKKDYFSEKEFTVNNAVCRITKERLEK